MKASELIEDLTIYPRNQVDEFWISSLAHHLRNGAIFPPVLADKKSKKIVDGFHRCRAYTRVYGPDCDIPCETMVFKNEAEMFVESLRRNGTHGKPLSTVDRIMSVNRGQQLGVSLEVIASVLNIEPVRLGAKTELRTVRGPGGEVIVIKAAMNRGNGHYNFEQKHAAQNGFGKISLYAKLLNNLLRLNILDLAYGNVLEDLYLLRDTLNELLPERVKV